jgi:cobalt-zinc-cadmium efflux system membrane fusion protein
MQARSSALLWGCAAAASLLASCQPPAASDPPPGPPAGQAWVTPESARAAGIVSAPVQVENLGRRLTASGRVTFDDRHVSHVFSPVNGRVTRLIAGAGQPVRRGDPLAVIESPDLGSAWSDYAKARAAMAQAEREYRRQKELFAARAAAQRDLEGAESNEGQARAELERAAARARMLGGGRLGDGISQELILRSPIDGEVIARNINPGVEVQGQYSGGTAVELFTIGDLDQVWVLADVFEIDLPQVRVGAPAEVEVVALAGRKLLGHVDWISDNLDPATRTAKVRCALANPGRALKPEMYAAVAIAVPGRRALAVPRGAVLRQGDQTVVFREIGVGPGGAREFERWPVQVDDEGSDAAVAVLRGLNPGDRVVTSGGILLLGMI